MVVSDKIHLPAGAGEVLNRFAPRADWVCGWIDESEGYQTCYCVFFIEDDLHCARIFPIGFGTPNVRWDISVDKMIRDLH